MKSVPAVSGGEQGDGEADIDPDGDNVGADEAGQLPDTDLGGVAVRLHVLFSPVVIVQASRDVHYHCSILARTEN